MSEETSWIQDVWSYNLESEMKILRELVERYPYISMDTEFPGVVARPVGNFKSTTDYHYQTLRCNVDLLKIIQLGITFADENGNLPENVCTWQFHFKFNLQNDMYAQDSIDLLTNSGIDFEKNDKYGIDVEYFGELLISSGFVLLDDVKWISFHSGYDFCYLLKILTCQALPAEERSFFELLKIYFPCIYDIKYLMKSCKNLKGGLQDVADFLKVERIGPQHQAGSDSLLTSKTFFKMRQTFFEDTIDDTKFLGFLYGLSSPNAPSTHMNSLSSSVILNLLNGNTSSSPSSLNGSTSYLNHTNNLLNMASMSNDSVQQNSLNTTLSSSNSSINNIDNTQIASNNNV